MTDQEKSPENAALRTPTMAQRLGRSPLLAATGKPGVNVDDPNVKNIARAVCGNLPPGRLFRINGTLYTIDQTNALDRNGVYTVDTVEMHPKRLRSWLADFFVFQKGSGDKTKAVKMPAELAETLFWDDMFRRHCPEVEMVLPVRLPVWGAPTETGARSVKLADVGYDPVTKAYTADTLDYVSGTPRYTPAQLRHVWDRLMHTFPWGVESEGEAKAVWRLGQEVRTGAQPCTNRSACCVLALMLGQYVRLMVDDLMPIGMFNANQPGSGKTLLAAMCVTPVWGPVAGNGSPKNDDEVVKSLQASLLSHAPFCMMDDVPGLNNNYINMITTMRVVNGRLLGSLNTFNVINNMQIFATGNDIFSSVDVERRSLIVDIFMAESAIGRKFKAPLTQKKLGTAAWRADLLRFMYSMVMNWADAGCPDLAGACMPTFESYSSIVGSILKHNGFASPFAERRYTGAGGDLIGRTVLQLLGHIVSQVMGDMTTATYSVAEIVEIANAINVTETITGGKAPNHSMGKRLEKYRGRELRDLDGRPFEFGKREESGKSCYTFTRK